MDTIFNKWIAKTIQAISYPVFQSNAWVPVPPPYHVLGNPVIGIKKWDLSEDT